MRLHPSFAAQRRESVASPKVKGGGAPIDAPTETALRQRHCRLSGVEARRAPCAQARSPFGAPPRLSPSFQAWLSPVPRFMVADNRSAPRAASSWQTGQSSQTEVWPAGRVSEPPERSLRNRARAPRPLRSSDRIRKASLRRASGGLCIGRGNVVKRCRLRRDKGLMRRGFRRRCAVVETARLSRIARIKQMIRCDAIAGSTVRLKIALRPIWVAALPSRAAREASRTLLRHVRCPLSATKQRT